MKLQVKFERNILVLIFILRTGTEVEWSDPYCAYMLVRIEYISMFCYIVSVATKTATVSLFTDKIMLAGSLTQRKLDYKHQGSTEQCYHINLSSTNAETTVTMSNSPHSEDHPS